VKKKQTDRQGKLIRTVDNKGAKLFSLNICTLGNTIDIISNWKI